MSLFELALDYASLQGTEWERTIFCLRPAGFSYRMHAGVPVFSVPRGDADASGITLLAWLFGRHALFLKSGSGDERAAWVEAANFFKDLCLLANAPCQFDAFQQQCTAALESSKAC